MAPLIKPFSSRDVILCTGCGKGFLVMPRGHVDLDPLWKVVSTGEEGGICGGEIRVVDATFAAAVADQFKEIGG